LVYRRGGLPEIPAYSAESLAEPYEQPTADLQRIMESLCEGGFCRGVEINHDITAENDMKLFPEA